MRFTTLILVLIFGGLLLAGASWALASGQVSNLLGAPPPRMGTSTTSFEYRGEPSLKGHPRVWKFTFGPTAIPGAKNVRIFVDPTGHVLRTEPANLADLVHKFDSKGY